MSIDPSTATPTRDAAGLAGAEPPALRHTPYDGSRKPFSIALAPLDLAHWIETDTRLVPTLAERERLLAEKREVVFREEPGSRPAQAETLARLVAHLLESQPEVYRREDDAIRLVPADRLVRLDSGEPPLITAGRLVSDDLVIMSPGEGGYRLTAAVLCFPSAWSLADKFGKSLDGIHAAVPGYPDKMARVMNRIFENLKVEQPVWRVNWSIYPDDELHHPESKERPRDWFGEDGDLATAAFVRVERQTLRRLPESGDILFTIRVHVDPFTAFRRHPEGAALAAGLREQILGLDPGQLAYKALTDHRDAVAGALARLAGLA
ncbi:heme-dependent oxidative N-demethylase family protein [Ancylobacter lacus]|uniref:heme-dependent oxidative N-demethylase family protein n=1 Tax=Ancylobacter lacus TaxID=2579970 RepID=UPI001BCD27F1|nr:DUF3445 domain-containing protein [Ancylobacter lacus]MBS7541161.1 DUF3445 domain-containing protein [Ancylobacter lacus]